MSDPHDRLGVARPEGGFWWLQGRAGRREYWAYVGALMLISLLLRDVPPVVSLVGATALTFVQARRLHDVDRSGWWALAALLAPVVTGLAVYVGLQSELAAVIVSSILTLAGIVWIGVLPGSPGDNRFGPEPPFTTRRLLTGR